MSKTQNHIDQLGRQVEIPSNPKRIVSLVPSQTELLYDLGLADRVVGITKFCVHPEKWFRNKTRVGGTKKLNFEGISALNPDLIIANKEENNKEDIEQLERDFPVWISDINDLESSIEMIGKVGEITGSNSSNIVRQIQDGFSELKPISPPKTTLYLIWKGPYMAAGSGTFVHDIMSRCGFENATNQARYPELSEEAIIKLNPELVLLSSEPFPFKEKHIQELQELLPKAEIRLVDGEMFSWYGSRLRLAPAYFQGLMKS